MSNSEARELNTPEQGSPISFVMISLEAYNDLVSSHEADDNAIYFVVDPQSE